MLTQSVMGFDSFAVFAVVVVTLPLLAFATAWLYYMLRGRFSITHLIMFVAYSAFMAYFAQAI